MYLFPVHVTPRAVSRPKLRAPVRAGRGPAHDQERDHGDGLQLRHVPRHHVSGKHVHHHAAHTVVSASGSYKLTRQKILKVAKIKDANYGCNDEGNDDGKVDDNGGFLFLSY